MTVFFQQLVQTNNKESIKGCWPFVRGVYWYYFLSAFHGNALDFSDVSIACSDWQQRKKKYYFCPLANVGKSTTQIAKFMGPTWGPPGSCLSGQSQRATDAESVSVSWRLWIDYPQDQCPSQDQCNFGLETGLQNYSTFMAAKSVQWNQ